MPARKGQLCPQSRWIENPMVRVLLRARAVDWNWCTRNMHGNCGARERSFLANLPALPHLLRRGRSKKKMQIHPLIKSRGSHICPDLSLLSPFLKTKADDRNEFQHKTTHENCPDLTCGLPVSVGKSRTKLIDSSRTQRLPALTDLSLVYFLLSQPFILKKHREQTRQQQPLLWDGS